MRIACFCSLYMYRMHVLDDTDTQITKHDIIGRSFITIFCQQCDKFLLHRKGLNRSHSPSYSNTFTLLAFLYFYDARIHFLFVFVLRLMPIVICCCWMFSWIREFRQSCSDFCFSLFFVCLFVRLSISILLFVRCVYTFLARRTKQSKRISFMCTVACLLVIIRMWQGHHCDDRHMPEWGCDVAWIKWIAWSVWVGGRGTLAGL